MADEIWSPAILNDARKETNAKNKHPASQIFFLTVLFSADLYAINTNIDVYSRNGSLSISLAEKLLVMSNCCVDVIYIAVDTSMIMEG